MRYCVLLFCFLLLASTCNDERLFEQNIAIKGEKWNYKETIHFDVNIPDTTIAYNVLISTRNTGSFSYSNLFLFISTQAPTGTLLRDTFEIELADKEGKWYGKSIGNLFFLQTYYKKSVKFPYRGIYMFDIQQAMWDDELKGISDIGIRIEKAG